MEDTIELLRIGWSPQVRPRAVERVVDILVTTLTNPLDGSRSRYGLPVSQVHSIVRLDAKDALARVRQGVDRPQLDYEDTWIPMYHLREVLGWGAMELADYHGTLRILAMRAPADAAGRPSYKGFIMEEVNEIMTCPLEHVQPFPSWILRDLPATTVWGALPDSDGRLLLLLDGMALAAHLEAG
ncbi:MAG TPA: chemotaxis protein CheW [Chloroflexia bacterium]|nr:chemotaxis protein CheW [Chloroflexia bacterium]